MKIGFISCSKSKHNYSLKAREIYNSQLFKKSLTYSLKHYDKTYILSAKYKVLDLDEVIEPYDLTLNKMNKNSINIWSLLVASQINKLVKSEDELFFLTGKKYYEQVIPKLENRNIKILMKNLSIGRRLQWLGE